MSASLTKPRHTAAADALEVHSDGAVHAHIMPVKFYVAIFFGLIMLTLLTVGIASIHLGQWNLVVAIVIASMKASLVLGFFMHLHYDNKFNALVVVLSIMFIGIFFAYTLNDTEHRGEIDVDQGVKVLPSTGSAAPGGPPVPAPTATEKSATGEMTPKPTEKTPMAGGGAAASPAGAAPSSSAAPSAQAAPSAASAPSASSAKPAPSASTPTK